MCLKFVHLIRIKIFKYIFNNRFTCFFFRKFIDIEMVNNYNAKHTEDVTQHNICMKNIFLIDFY